MCEIDAYKKQKRAEYRKFRAELDREKKSEWDRELAKRVINEIKGSSLVLSYVSTENEADTYEIMRYCLDSGIRLAVPKCIANTPLMDFYYIKTLGELEKGAFSIYEPQKSCEKVSDFTGAVCLVPAMSYDEKGYRIGYGGGYYDRFLSGHDVKKIGMCYERCLEKEHIHSEYDIKADLIITQNRTIHSEE